MTAPLLLPYQQRWLEDPSPVRCWLKSRRIGASFAAGVGAVLDAAAGANVLYLAQNESQSRIWMKQLRKTAQALSAVAPILDDEADEHMYRIAFRSGAEILALTSSPANLRGKSGNVILDEAAYHPDLEELVAAALPLTLEGRQVSIVSTPASTEDQFWSIVEKLRAGELPWSLHATTFDDAIADGYFRRIAAPMQGVEPTDGNETLFRIEVYTQLGDAADTELRCKPRGSGGAYLPRDVVARGAHTAPVVRLRWPVADIEGWAQSTIDPLIERLDPRTDHAFGYDFALVGDGSVFLPIELLDDHRRVPWALEMSGVPYAAQREIVGRIIERLPRLTRGIVDATGVGAPIAAELIDRFGPVIVAGKFTGGTARPREEQTPESLRWAEILPRLKQALEAGSITIPDDPDVLNDFQAFTLVRGLPTICAARTRGRSGVQRHGDAAVAIALAMVAAESQARATSLITASNPLRLVV